MICPVLEKRGRQGVKAPRRRSAVELERMIKLQELILEAMAKKISWLERFEIAGVRNRTI